MKFRMYGPLMALLFLYACEFGTAPTGGGTGGEGLSGILVDSKGSGVAGAKVFVYPDAAPAAKRAGAQVAQPDSTTTGKDGRFRFAKLPDGRYNLEASATRHDTVLAVFLRGIDFAKKLDLGKDTLRVSGSLTVQVRTAAGAVAGALCSLVGTSRTTVSDAGGKCAFTGLGPGTYQVSTTFEGRTFTTANLTVVSSVTTGAGLDVAPAGTGGETQIPANWILAYAQGYAFYMPPDMEFQGESQETDIWTAQYGSSRIGLSLFSGYGGITRPAYPGYFEDTLVLDSNSSAFYRTFRETDARIQVTLEVEKKSPGMTMFYVVFNATGASFADSAQMALMLRSVQVWKGPGPAPVPAPSKAVLHTPAAGATTTASPLLTWFAPANAAGTTYYRVQVSEDSTFVNLLANDSASRLPIQSSDRLSRTVGPLALFRTYYWRVLSFGPGGIVSSEIRAFRTETPPPAPVLRSPAANATVTSLSPQLTWGEVLLDGPAQIFRLQVSKDTLFGDYVLNDSISGPNFNGNFYSGVGPLEPATRYFWRVVQIRNGLSATSATRAFTTPSVSGEAPIVPQLASPAANTNATVDSQSFSWTSWNRGASTSHYHFQLATDSLFLNPVLNDSVPPSNFETGLTVRRVAVQHSTQYYWRVIGVGPGGSTPSETRRFSTFLPPQAVPLSSPAFPDTGRELSPELAWGVYYASNRTEAYRMQVAEDTLFSMLVVDETRPGQPIPESEDGLRYGWRVGPLSPGKKYFWRVISEGKGGLSAPSDTRSFVTRFKTTDVVPLEPELTSPTANATGVSAMPTFKWFRTTTGPHTDYFHLQIATDNSFRNPAVNDTVAARATALEFDFVERTLSPAHGNAPLRSGTPYFWRVAGVGKGGVTFSEVWTFTTQ
jgi:hypothetical protein